MLGVQRLAFVRLPVGIIQTGREVCLSFARWCPPGLVHVVSIRVYDTLTLVLVVVKEERSDDKRYEAL